MVDLPSYYLELITIPCLLDDIDFHSREIGFFKKCFEKTENDKFKQWYNYFINYSEIEIEQSNNRIKEYREKLISQ